MRRGRDEESRNGRDIKIDILDHVIRTSEVFRIVSGKNGVPEGLPEPSGELMGHIGPWWREREAARAGRTPSPLGPYWTREWGVAPPFPTPSPSPSLPPSPS